MNNLWKHIEKLDRYVSEIKKEYQKTKDKEKQKRLLEIGNDLKEILRVHKMKQEDLGFVIKRNSPYVSRRLNAKDEFTEEEQRAIRLHFNLDKSFFFIEEEKKEKPTLEEIYIKYNKIQYSASNMKFETAQQILSESFMDLLNELEELL